jgi:hypothetical protein
MENQAADLMVKMNLAIWDGQNKKFAELIEKLSQTMKFYKLL